MKRYLFIGFTLLFISNAHALDKIKLNLKWYHQAQFAGFYVAKEKNYYLNNGIEIVFIEGGPQTSSSGAVLDKKSDFAVTSPEDLIRKVSDGYNLKAVASIYRKSAVVFLSKKGSGIIKPEDFKSKVVAADNSKSAPEFVMQLRAMMENMHINLSSIKLVSYDPNYRDFLKGSVDITPAYYTGGLIKLNQKGIKLNIIYPGDFRVRFYSDILVTSEDLILRNRDLVERFVRASLQGWKYAIENIDETIPIIMKYSRIKDEKLQRSMLDASIPLIFTGDDVVGWMTLMEWDDMYKILMKQKLIDKPVKDISKVFTTEFIEKEF